MKESGIPALMIGISTTGTGGYERLEYLENLPVPEPGPTEVLVRVLAAGVNNTEINTRLGWYSTSVDVGTNSHYEITSDGSGGMRNGGWNKKTPFPLIQGTDCCGEVVKIGALGNPELVGKRVLVRPCVEIIDSQGGPNCQWMGSDFNGSFAQFVVVPQTEVFPISSDWTDEELGVIPCAYGTAENMCINANVEAGDTVLIPGGSGGVATAAIKLCKLRGATVISITNQSKRDYVLEMGADIVYAGRHGGSGWKSMTKDMRNQVDVVIDNVGGEGFLDLLNCLKANGSYVCSGAINGPVVPLDLRTMYLQDLTLIGTTSWSNSVFPNLIGYIQQSLISPPRVTSFPLRKIEEVQKLFIAKEDLGKFALMPPAPGRL